MKKLLSALGGIGMAVIFIFGFFFFFKQPQQCTENILIVGTASGYAPFVSLNAQGEYEGFDIDFAKELAQKLDKKLVIKDLGSMNTLFIALDQKMIDVIIWGLSITQKRLQKVDMIAYQGDTTTVYELLFWKNIPDSICSIDDMKELTVAVEPGSSQEAVLDKFPFINKKSMEKITDALLDLQYGKSDAIFVEPAIAKKFKQKFPNDLKSISVPLSNEEYVFGVGIAIKKDRPSLTTDIKQAIDQLRSEGVIERLEKKWEL